MVDSKKPEKGLSKVCYYELLDVDRKADTKAIKKVLKLLLIFKGLLKSSAKMASRQKPR